MLTLDRERFADVVGLRYRNHPDATSGDTYLAAASVAARIAFDVAVEHMPDAGIANTADLFAALRLAADSFTAPDSDANRQYALGELTGLSRSIGMLTGQPYGEVLATALREAITP